MGRGAHRLLLVGLAIGLILLPSAGAPVGVTSRLSVGPGGAQADGRSFAPALSADGRYAAFYSDASNLVAGDTKARGFRVKLVVGRR